MPAETIFTLCLVLGAFVFFAGVVAFTDLTWNKQPARIDKR